jgi:hypothetical protein
VNYLAVKYIEHYDRRPSLHAAYELCLVQQQHSPRRVVQALTHAPGSSGRVHLKPVKPNNTITSSSTKTKTKTKPAQVYSQIKEAMEEAETSRLARDASLSTQREVWKFLGYRHRYPFQKRIAGAKPRWGLSLAGPLSPAGRYPLGTGRVGKSQWWGDESDWRRCVLGHPAGVQQLAAWGVWGVEERSWKRVVVCVSPSLCPPNLNLDREPQTLNMNVKPQPQS